MGAVYLALEPEGERAVALKVLLPQFAADADARERFVREGRACAAVRHPNVVTVYRVGETGDTPFIAMELLSGFPLDVYLKRKGRLTVAQALRVGSEAASGLAAAHAVGLVHRDIKPSNLWLEAPHGRIKLLDFGLAKPIEATGTTGRDLTTTGQVLGTPAYMSPEQARGEPMDHRSDLFSLGVVLYELCTGTRPFDRATAVASVIALATEPARPVRELNPEVPDALARAIHWLLEKDPAARPATAAQVAALFRDLERVAALPVYVAIPVAANDPTLAFLNLDDAPTGSGSGSESASEPAPRRAPRPRSGFGAWALVALAVLVACAVAVGVYRSRADAPPAPVAKPEPLKPSPPKPKFDPQRAACRWVFETGGTVTVADPRDPKKELTATKWSDLPQGELTVLGVSFMAVPYRVTDADVDRLRPFADLRTLLLWSETELTTAGLARLAALPCAKNLRELNLRFVPAGPGAPGTGGGGAHLAKFTGLVSLVVVGLPLAGELDFLKSLPNLGYLALGAAQLTDADVTALVGAARAAPALAGAKAPAPPRLFHLNLSDNPAVTRACFEPLARLPNLQQLYIAKTGIKPDDLPLLERFPALTHVAVNPLNGLRDEHLVPLARLPQLDALFLGGNPITDAGLDHLAPATGLSYIDLYGTEVTDAGLMKLAAFPKLAHVSVVKSRVTPVGVEAFKAKRPGVQVDHE
jgi:hypothetical protein